MRQRVMIAMALSCNPQLLIADEPTTALDVTIQAQIVDLVKRLRDEIGMAIIWITHDLGVVAGLADRVIVMYAGYIVEESPVKELYANPAPPLHPRPAGLAAPPGRSPRAPPHLHRGPAARSDRPAQGLPVLRPLRLSHREVRDRESQAWNRSPRPQDRLLGGCTQSDRAADGAGRGGVMSDNEQHRIRNWSKSAA